MAAPKAIGIPKAASKQAKDATIREIRMIGANPRSIFCAHPEDFDFAISQGRTLGKFTEFGKVIVHLRGNY